MTETELLTFDEMTRLASILDTKSKSIRSDNIAPVDVNILPMAIIVDTELVNDCVDILMGNYMLSPMLAKDIVLSVFEATQGTGRGCTKYIESELDGHAPGTPSGSDNS